MDPPGTRRQSMIASLEKVGIAAQPMETLQSGTGQQGNIRPQSGFVFTHWEARFLKQASLFHQTTLTCPHTFTIGVT